MINVNLMSGGMKYSELRVHEGLFSYVMKKLLYLEFK